MLLSIGMIILAGLLLGWIVSKIQLPRIIGMLLAGMLLGPYVLNVLDSSIIDMSGDLRKIALIIIIAKAGLSLDITDLKRIGRPAIMLCFVPATLELIAFVLFAPFIMGVTLLQAAILGAVMGAVSPAVTVPRLTKMIDEGIGVKKGIPQMLIAGASADDIYVIVLFTTLVGLEAGGNMNALSLLRIPEEIILGAVTGGILGVILAVYFKKVHIRDSLKVTIIMAFSMILYWIEGIAPVSGLLAVMTMGIALNVRLQVVAKRLSAKFSKLWVAAEIFLFVLVGATVNIGYVTKAGVGMVIMLFVGLLFREFGTLISVLGVGLNKKEILFCLISQLPKATVQAAIGGVPLAMGLSCGNVVLTMAVVSIVITAPLGAIGMDATVDRFISRDKEADTGSTGGTN
ncbi:MAG: cation:proton antiporter [Butyrivibrio sp.]|nr:cation:proton antiporter [Butyrivibrio sp.]SNU09882.1 sodium/proton antiporter, CPA1 family [Lachnospiraceae bacterium]